MKTRDKPIEVIVHWETPMDELSRKATEKKLEILERSGKLREILELISEGSAKRGQDAQWN